MKDQASKMREMAKESGISEQPSNYDIVGTLMVNLEVSLGRLAEVEIKDPLSYKRLSQAIDHISIALQDAKMLNV